MEGFPSEVGCSAWSLCDWQDFLIRYMVFFGQWQHFIHAAFVWVKVRVNRCILSKDRSRQVYRKILYTCQSQTADSDRHSLPLWFVAVHLSSTPMPGFAISWHLMGGAMCGLDASWLSGAEQGRLGRKLFIFVGYHGTRTAADQDHSTLCACTHSIMLTRCICFLVLTLIMVLSILTVLYKY